MFDLICGYAINGEVKETENIVAKNMFLLIRPQIDANNKKFTNWKKGWRSKKIEEK